jgi:hypothetical protein
MYRQNFVRLEGEPEAQLDQIPNSKQYQWDPWCVQLWPSNQGVLVHNQQTRLDHAQS